MERRGEKDGISSLLSRRCGEEEEKGSELPMHVYMYMYMYSPCILYIVFALAVYMYMYTCTCMCDTTLVYVVSSGLVIL